MNSRAGPSFCHGAPRGWETEDLTSLSSSRPAQLCRVLAVHCVTLDQFLLFSVPQFASLQNKDNEQTCLNESLCKGVRTAPSAERVLSACEVMIRSPSRPGSTFASTVYPLKPHSAFFVSRNSSSSFPPLLPFGLQPFLGYTVLPAQNVLPQTCPLLVLQDPKAMLTENLPGFLEDPRPMVPCRGGS